VVDAREFVRKLEWDVYKDFAEIRDSGIKPPSLYESIKN
jgi:hypothetical protein